MADFVAVLKKTLDGLGSTTPAAREKVYEKARATIEAKLAAINPPPPRSVADRQRQALEDAIVVIEREYTAASDPLAELENVFASLKNPQPPRPAVAPPRPAATPPRPAPAPIQQTPRPAAPTRVPPAPDSTYVPRPDMMVEPEPDVADDERERASMEREPRRGLGWLLIAAVLLAVVAGGGYGIWLNKDTFGSLLGMGGGSQTTEAAPETTTTPAEGTSAEPAQDAQTDQAQPPAAADGGEGAKFTQRLNSDGSEVDEGPAGGAATLGEGTSVAAVTQAPGVQTPAPGQPATGDATPGVPATPGTESTATAATPPAGQLAVGQKAIFYEERTAQSEGSAEPGTIVWSLVQESPGNDLPPEPAIRAEATIPGKDIQLKMTIRRNADQTLPASHIIEMIFITPQGFAGGGIENILRVAMKGSEQEAGNPLIGIPAKIADGFFLVALNDTKPEIDSNLSLLRSQDWIDVPLVYKNGRRALFTMEKGIPGDKVFDEAVKAWQAKAAG